MVTIPSFTVGALYGDNSDIYIEGITHFGNNSADNGGEDGVNRLSCKGAGGMVRWVTVRPTEHFLTLMVAG